MNHLIMEATTSIKTRMAKNKLSWIIRAKHHLSRFSQEGETKQNLKDNNFHLGVKTRYFAVITIAVIMLVSIFAVLQTATPTEESHIEPQSTNSSTAIPSPTNQETPQATAVPSASNPQSTPASYPRIWGLELDFDLRPVGIIESAKKMDSSVWKEVARQAWQYFQPGVGIDSTTGLPGAVSGWPYFTDWDLGVYIQAIIDAQKMGLVSWEGDWGVAYRFDKVLTFLETRPLNEYDYPFWFYQAGNGQNYQSRSDGATGNLDAVDSGRLFVALNNLRKYSPDYASRIDNIVLQGRSDYTAILPEIQSESNKTSLYAYYVWSGFAAFWPDEVGNVSKQILNNIKNSEPVSVNQQIVLPNGTVVQGNGNVTLPNAEILCEPLLQSVFELNNNDNEERTYLENLSRQVYLAHEEYHNITGEWIAFSEGGSGSGTFIYEWVNLPELGSWKVTTIDRIHYPMKPIIYSKVALSFLALYNTTYAKNLCIYLEKCLPQQSTGWSDGADFTIEKDNRNIIPNVSCNTNGMILAASRYYIQNNP